MKKKKRKENRLAVHLDDWASCYLEMDLIVVLPSHYRSPQSTK